MNCPDCEGKGYNVKGYVEDFVLEPVKVWCETCKGTGKVDYNGDRTGVEWEGE
jgi:DnaJ-class molecular chaperone